MNYLNYELIPVSKFELDLSSFTFALCFNVFYLHKALQYETTAGKKKAQGSKTVPLLFNAV